MRRSGIFGPVFRYESMIASRRWQVYATRMLFVGLLLACLSTIWRIDTSGSFYELRAELAGAGRRFFTSTVVIELVLVLLAAPAATAGAICLDKSRGTLTHLLTTDLGDTEIIGGKLAARLMPVLALLACALPVSGLAVMLGGVEPKALVSALIVVAGVAIFGCSLTMLYSVWGSKPHEVLAAVYLTWVAWLSPWFVLSATRESPAPDPWIDAIGLTSPFWLALDSSSAAAGDDGWLAAIRASLIFLAVMVAISLACAVVAVRSLRPASLRMANRKLKPVVDSRAVLRFRREVPWWPSPSLDKNPVLWREWHRARPTLWMRIVWAIYLGTTFVASVLAVALIFDVWKVPYLASSPVSMIIGATSALGFLLMSVTSATSLSEERVRGSLDVLMATPLSTRSIVWGKWRGTFRLVATVLFWPFLVCYAIVVRITPSASLGVFYVMLPYGVAFGAFVTSLGLALACWISRLGRALAVAVGIYVLIALGVPMISPDHGSPWIMASPLFAMMLLAERMRPGDTFQGFGDVMSSGLVWTVIYAGTAAGLFAAVNLTFNRVLGRVSERPRGRARPASVPARRANVAPSEARV